VIYQVRAVCAQHVQPPKAEEKAADACAAMMAVDMEHAARTGVFRQVRKLHQAAGP